MLQYIKKYMKGWFLGIILFFIFISFAFWGVGDIFRGGSSYILKIGKYKISRDTFLREFESNVNYLKKNKKLNKIELENVVNETLSNLKDRYLILNAANLMNLNISEKILRKKIYENELFQNKLKNNKFDKNIYTNFISRNFSSEENYLEYLKNQILIEIIANYFEKKIYYPQNLTNKIYNKLEEKKSFQIASIDKNYQRTVIKIPNKESMLKYFNKNKKKYLFDERRSFSYIFVNLNYLKKKVEVNEDEIIDSYNNQKQDFLVPEKRKVEQLFFDNEEIGKKILNSINKENKFKEIAEKEKEKNISYIALGLVEKEQLFDEFADQVFKLKENEFSKLIKTDIGWHILKVTEIIKSKSKKLSEVKNTIKEDIALTKSYDELDIVLNEVEDELTNGANLEEISNKLNLDLINVKLLEKKSFFNSDLPNEIKINNFYQEVFEEELNSDLFIEEIEDGFFIVRVDEIVNEQLKTFEEAYNDLIKDVKEERINKKINNIIKKFNKKIQEGVGFIEISDLLKMNSRITKKLNREDIINQGFSFEFTNKIFESKKNTIHENETSDNYYVVKVISDSEVKFNNERFNVVKKSVNKIYGIDNLQQITKILENKFPISVNKNLLNEFIDRLQY
jgi:peptidyl-prolyl cis-trans isomerase D